MGHKKLMCDYKTWYKLQLLNFLVIQFFKEVNFIFLTPSILLSTRCLKPFYLKECLTLCLSFCTSFCQQCISSFLRQSFKSNTRAGLQKNTHNNVRNMECPSVGHVAAVSFPRSPVRADSSWSKEVYLNIFLSMGGVSTSVYYSDYPEPSFWNKHTHAIHKCIYIFSKRKKYFFLGII